MTNPTTKTLEHIIAVMPGIVFWKNVAGQYQGCNDNAAQLAGLASPQAIIGKTLWDLFDQPLAAKIEAIDNHVIATKQEHVEEEPGVDLQGQPAIYLTRKVPLLDDNTGEVVGLVGISIDITAQKQLEADLIKAKEAADAANQAKTMFLANMSHDLKTPLAGIISTAEQLSERLNDADHQNRANDIAHSGMHLLELLVEIIEVSRLDQNMASNLAPFQPRDLFNDLMQLLKPAILQKGLSFHLRYQQAIPTTLIGDRWQLYRIILNLLSNALKFTHEGSITLTVMLDQYETEQITLKIMVEDTGIGIPADKQQLVFEQFTRLTQAHDQTYKGNGLGLFIVKKFTEAMHGTIQVNSQEGSGSCFTCLIPFQIPQPLQLELLDSRFSQTTFSVEQQALKPSTLSTEERQLFERSRLLLVEDNLIVARAEKDMLESLGCQVDIAASGHEALKLMGKNLYHLVFLDLGLPDMTGFDLAKALKLIEGKNQIPILALSAHVDDAITHQCLAVGIVAAITKPLLKARAKTLLPAYLLGSTDSSLAAPIIDVESAAAALGIEPETIQRSLSLLLASLSDYHGAICHAYQTQDREALIQSTHKLHGGLLYSGTPRLQQTVRAFETAARSKPEAEWPAFFDHYCHEIDALSNAYPVFLASGKD